MHQEKRERRRAAPLPFVIFPAPIDYSSSFDSLSNSRRREVWEP